MKRAASKMDAALVCLFDAKLVEFPIKKGIFKPFLYGIGVCFGFFAARLSIVRYYD